MKKNIILAVDCGLKGECVMNGKIREVGYDEFSMSLKLAKSTIQPEYAWRVSTYEKEHYAEISARCYVTEKGSTVAISGDGDIISLCRHSKDTDFRGKDLLAFAKDNGGYKLDCYSGLADFYERNGFHLVDRWAWDPQYAPSDWKPIFGEEDVLFYETVIDDDTLSINDRIRQLNNCQNVRQCDLTNYDELSFALERMEKILQEKGVSTDIITLPEHLCEQLLEVHNKLISAEIPYEINDRTI